jgi:hypothetical protein
MGDARAVRAVFACQEERLKYAKDLKRASYFHNSRES